MRTLISLVFLLVTLVLSGCTSTKPFTEEEIETYIGTNEEIMIPKSILPFTLQKDTRILRAFGMTQGAGQALKEIYKNSIAQGQNISFCLYGTMSARPERLKIRDYRGVAQIIITNAVRARQSSLKPCATSQTYVGMGRTETRIGYKTKNNTLQEEDMVAFWKRSDDMVTMVMYGYQYEMLEKGGKELQIDTYWRFKDGRGLRWLWVLDETKDIRVTGSGYAAIQTLPSFEVVDTSTIAKIELREEAARAIADMHNKGTRDEREKGFCLYGTFSLDADKKTVLTITDVTSAIVSLETPNGVYYEKNPCEGTARYVGRGHSHVAIHPAFGTPTPELSRRDKWSFWRRRGDILTLVVWKTNLENETLTLWLDYKLKHGPSGAWVWKSSEQQKK